jgi:hypothetical protein
MASGASGRMEIAVRGTASPWLAAALALPFAAFGLGAIAARASGELGADEPLLRVAIALFGALFVGVAALVVGAAVYARREARAVAARRERHPDEPWRWSGRWDDPRLRSAGRGGVVAAWIIAAVWNGISSPLVLVFLPEEVIGKGRWAEGAVAAIFPLVGLGLLVVAARATLRHRRFGVSILELARVPGVLGGELAATLRAGAALGEARALAARLACVRETTTGSGRDRTTTESVLWADEQAVPLAGAARGPEGLAVPLRFAVPADLPPSDALPTECRVLWRLEAEATLSGVDYAACFEVPVFQTRETRAERTAEAISRERTAPLALGAGPLAGVHLRPDPGGGAELFFPVGRHLPQAGLAAAFGALFLGGGLLARANAAPAPIAWVCAGVAALTAYAALQLACGSVRLVARRDGVRLQHRLFGLGRTREIPRAAIAGVSVEPGMQAGQRTYWDLHLRLADAGPAGRPRLRARTARIGGGLRDRADAERLAAAVRAALGLA